MKAPEDFDYFDPKVLENPHDFNAVLREQAPVYQVPGSSTFLISRYVILEKPPSLLKYFQMT